jgi:S-formylglutathione hydrolase FrmB
VAVGVGAWRARRLVVRVAVAALAGVVLAGAGSLGWAVASGYVPDVRALTMLTEAHAPLPPALAPGSEAVPPHATSRTRGVTWRVRLPSASAGVADRYAWVHVPPGYDDDPTRRYPVVYLLQGSPGTGTDWFSAGHADVTADALVVAGRLAPTIVVSPDLGLGLDQEPLDRPGGAQLATFVSHDVVAWTDAHLRTVPDAAHRVLGGMSAGAFGALVTGVTRPDVFGAVVAILPYERPSEADLRHGDARGGPSTPGAAVDAAHDAGLPAVPAYLVAASSDDPDEARHLGAVLTGAGHEVRVDVRGGRNDWRFARAALGPGLVWAEGALSLVPGPS